MPVCPGEETLPSRRTKEVFHFHFSVLIFDWRDEESREVSELNEKFEMRNAKLLLFLD